jgi:Response regulator containing a CheY-like receiver domain and an HTH DNA-binding domain
MREDRRVSVVVLYMHPLFGEGIARLLAAEPGMDVTPVAASDPEQAQRLLALAPDVVVFERGDPDTATDILRYAPSALVIDVSLSPGPTFTYQRQEIQAQPEVILQAVRHASSRRGSEPAPVPMTPQRDVARS